MFTVLASDLESDPNCDQYEVFLFHENPAAETLKVPLEVVGDNTKNCIYNLNYNDSVALATNHE